MEPLLPWEGLAPGAPHLHSPPSWPPPERGAEHLQGAVDPVVLSVSRPAPPGPLAADGRGVAGAAKKGEMALRTRVSLGRAGDGAHLENRGRVGTCFSCSTDKEPWFSALGVADAPNVVEQLGATGPERADAEPAAAAGPLCELSAGTAPSAET
ncbi:hypothetical protein R6Z07M_018815 [Ovis aries]